MAADLLVHFIFAVEAIVERIRILQQVPLLSLAHRSVLFLLLSPVFIGSVKQEVVFDSLGCLLDVFVQILAHVSVPVHDLVDLACLRDCGGTAGRCWRTGVDLFLAAVLLAHRL